MLIKFILDNELLGSRFTTPSKPETNSITKVIYNLARESIKRKHKLAILMYKR